MQKRLEIKRDNLKYMDHNCRLMFHLFSFNFAFEIMLCLQASEYLACKPIFLKKKMGKAPGLYSNTKSLR